MIVPISVWTAGQMIPPENPSSTQPRAACGSVVAVASVMCAAIWMSSDAMTTRRGPMRSIRVPTGPTTSMATSAGRESSRPTRASSKPRTSCR